MVLDGINMIYENISSDALVLSVCVFVYGQHIVSGNEAEVQRLLSESESEEDGRKLCHPLCSCDACDLHISGSVLTD